MNFIKATVLSAILVVLSSCGGGGSSSSSNASATGVAPAPTALAGVNRITLDPTLSLAQNLGKLIFNDASFSNPSGTACASCHNPLQGGSNNNGSTLGVVQGSLHSSIGLRNSLSNQYSANTPPFGFVTNPNGVTVAKGGLFWDGRADTLAQQAQLPFLNTLEMNNASQQAVVNILAAAPYAALFQQQYGPNIFNNPNQAFTQIANSLQAFQQSAQLQPFTSKFDLVVQGLASFTASEQNGLALYTDRNRANCGACHVMNLNSSSPKDSIFTDFSYHADGVPRNSAIPSNAVPTFYDLGLCGPERVPPVLPANVSPGITIGHFCGQFRTPSLRNTALKSNFMHNGVFTNLTQVVTFYATRVSNPKNFYGPSGIPNDLPPQYQSNLEVSLPPFRGPVGNGVPLLNAKEIADLVAFLNTLTDGYTGK